MYLVVGLGNPGAEYANTRHNAGFRVIENLAKRFGIFSLKSKCKSFIAQFEHQDRKIILAMPQTFMNNSGEAVSELAHWFKIKPEKIIVVYDDVDLELGRLRLRMKGSDGGHHGMESIQKHLKTTQFSRIRIGIGRPQAQKSVTSYVLENFSREDLEIIEAVVDQASQAVMDAILLGFETAMNKYNA